jgi:trehalose 6-phosphate phosphatase
LDLSDLPHPALAALLRDPSTTAIVADYDGTLSPIVEDPDEARPVEGTVEVLGRLAAAFGVVAVVSGRRLAFLLDQLRGAPPSVRMVGLYGLEWRGPDGTVIDPAARSWVPVVEEVADRLRSAAPPGVRVEDKELGVTVHWRRAPDMASWAESSVRHEADRSGLRAQPGKMAIELRLPLEVDKGTVLRELIAPCSAACYLGDDTGDLPAFAALTEAAERGMATVSVAVVGADTPPQVTEAVDFTLGGPEEALDLLRRLAEQGERRHPA